MPKVGKNKRLNRVARRVAASDPLPTSTTPTITSTTTTTIQQPKETKHDNNKNKEDNNNDKDLVTNGENQSLSRGQRKRLAKREQYLKREKLILSTLMLQKKEDQKRRIDGLDAIREALMETATTSKNDDTRNEQQNEDEHLMTYGSNRAKKGIMASEIERMNLVMEHPAFKEDPFGAIQEHLRNTLAGQKEKLEKEAKTKAIQDKIKHEQKKQEKKERLQGVKKSTKKYKTRRCK